MAFMYVFEEIPVRNLCVGIVCGLDEPMQLSWDMPAMSVRELEECRKWSTKIPFCIAFCIIKYIALWMLRIRDKVSFRTPKFPMSDS